MKPNYHGAQLCVQVKEAIELALLCDCSDPVLQDLEVVDVSPAGSGGVLLVTCATGERDDRDVERRLTAACGILRLAVGAGIHRKRVPSLKFRVVPQTT